MSDRELDASSTKMGRMVEFRARVAACRAKLDVIVWGAGGAPQALTASRVDSLYEAVLDALMSGVEAGFPSLVSVACAMDEVMPALRSVQGSSPPGVLSLLLQMVPALERTARDGSVRAEDLERLSNRAIAAASGAVRAVRSVSFDLFDDGKLAEDANGKA